MNTSIQRMFYYLGIIAAVYITFVYLIPLIFKLLGLAFTLLFKVFLFAAVVVVTIMAASFIIQAFKNKY